MLKDVLTALGYVVPVAEDGAHALRVVPGCRPDAVVLDLALPRVPGELVLELPTRRRHPLAHHRDDRQGQRGSRAQRPGEGHADRGHVVASRGYLKCLVRNDTVKRA